MTSTAVVLIIAKDHPRRRQLEDLLADRPTVVRALPEPEVSEVWPWDGVLPDLVVVAPWGESAASDTTAGETNPAARRRTEAAVNLVRAAMTLDGDASVLVFDEPEAWPETLRLMPGVIVSSSLQRARVRADRDRLLERRALLRAATLRQSAPEDALAAAALRSEHGEAREMALLLGRLEDRGAHIVLAGARGTLRSRILRHVTDGSVEDGARTLFVDDIDVLSPLDQGAVLEQVHDGRRVVATATAHLKGRLADGLFRRDVYYALGGQPVTTVPLAERRNDLDHLVEACVSDASAWREVVEHLRNYPWPGNLRELELVTEHAELLAGGGPIGVEHIVLPEEFVRSMLEDAFVVHIPRSGVPLDEVEREVLKQTLAATESNVTEAARRLAVGREKLRYRMRRLGLGR